MDTRSATQDPTLYLLHSALLLAVGSDRDYHGSDSSSTPLPKLGAAQARKFLQGVLDQTTDGEDASSQSRNKRRRLAGVRAHPPTRRSLWPDVNGEKAGSSNAATPAPIRTALDHLPAYWRQHNALCEGCGGIVLPGVTATYARKKKRRTRDEARGRREGGAACLVCRQEADEQGEKQGKRDDCSPISWLAEDVEAMQRSKGRFASVRSRKRKNGQFATAPPPPPSRPAKTVKADSTGGPGAAASKTPSGAATASAAMKEKASRKVDEAKPSSVAGPSRPGPGPADARATKKSTLPPAASAPATKPKPQPQPSPATAPPSDRKARPPPPAGENTNSSAKRDKPASTDVDQEKQRKHDHKAALRAMLSGAGGGGTGGGGSRKKKDKGGEGGGGQQGKGAGGGSSGGAAGGGGLADFLAGL